MLRLQAAAVQVQSACASMVQPRPEHMHSPGTLRLARLQRQANAASQVPETWRRMQRIHSGVNLYIQEPGIAFVVSMFKVAHRVVLVAQYCVEMCQIQIRQSPRL